MKHRKFCNFCLGLFDVHVLFSILDLVFVQDHELMGQ